MIKGIPTKYDSVNFRSRLEARWARFFYLCGWPWEYEPIDLNGYVPDFVLPFERYPVLVEVKPIFGIKQQEAEPHIDKIENSGWEHEALILGAHVPLGDPDCWHEACGLGYLGERGYGKDGKQWLWALAVASICRSVIGGIGFTHDYGAYFCRVCGAGYKTFDTAPVDRVVRLWREAGNAVQWRPR